jgi:hypothetical protein
MSIAKTLSWGSIASLVVGSLNLFISVYLFNNMVASEFANYVLLTSLISTTAAAAGGLQLAIARNISTRDAKPLSDAPKARPLRHELFLALVLTLFLWLLLTPVVLRLTALPYLLVVASYLGLASAGYTAIIDGFFIGKGMVWRTSWASITATITRAALALVWPLILLPGSLLALAMPLMNALSTRVFIDRRQLKSVLNHSALGLRPLIYPSLFVWLLFLSLQLDLWFGASERFASQAQADYGLISSITKAMVLLSMPLGLLLISYTDNQKTGQSKKTRWMISVLSAASGSSLFLLSLGVYLLSAEDSRWRSTALLAMAMSPGVIFWSLSVARLQFLASRAELRHAMFLVAFVGTYTLGLYTVDSSQIYVASLFSVAGAVLFVSVAFLSRIDP